MDHDFDVWEMEIGAYEAADRNSPPPKHALLFTGSSTIALWQTLAQDFPEHQVINRGFGGSEPVDSTHFADRIIFPYEPTAIFFYSGANALAAGKSPAEVFADVREFFETVHARLPETEIVFISLFATIDRWGMAEEFRAVNELMKEYAQGRPGLTYLEAFDLTFGPDGKPRPELFAEDMLHLNADGYELLAERVRPFLAAMRS
jgi:hypothetical protein